MTNNTNSPAPAIPQPAGDREAGSPPGSASRTLRERVAEAIYGAWRKRNSVEFPWAEVVRLGAHEETSYLEIRDIYLGAIAEADAAIAEVMAWQPIETAPKDRRIMLYRPTSTYTWAKVVAGKWDSDEWASKPRPYWSHDLSLLTGKQEERKCVPTHWMEMPSPPNRGEK